MIRLALSLVVLLAPTAPITTRIVLLVDVSGSMSNSGRAAQALGAASAITRQPVDEANVLPIAWSDTVTTYPGGWERLPSEEAAQRVDKWLSSQRTMKDTYLAPALRLALARPEKGLTIIIVTDGELHNESTTHLLKILKEGQAARAAPATVGVWQVGSLAPVEELKALAKAGGGGYVASND